MANYRCSDPFRALMWNSDWRPKKVTLPRVGQIEGGDTYSTVPFIHDDDGRGAHMRDRAMIRRTLSGVRT